MKSIKFLTYITAAFLFLVAPSVISAQVYCVFNENEKYRAEDAVIKKGDNLAFIKWCCEKSFDDGTKPCNAGTKDGELQHTAAKYKRTAVLEYLINDLGKKADVENESRQTPTMFAAESGFVPTTRFLVKDQNTNVIAKDMKGYDVMWYAKRSGNQDVITLVKGKVNELLGMAAVQHKFKQNQFQKTMAAADPAKEIKNSIAATDFENLKKYLLRHGLFGADSNNRTLI